MKTYYVYMITNWKNEVLYTGVTNDLARRISEHREKKTPGFASRYNVYKLVFFESNTDINAAIAREKEIKGWVRRKKNALIETLNPNWADLAIEYGIINDKQGVTCGWSIRCIIQDDKRCAVILSLFCEES